MCIHKQTESVSYNSVSFKDKCTSWTVMPKVLAVVGMVECSDYLCFKCLVCATFVYFSPLDYIPNVKTFTMFNLKLLEAN